MSLPARDEALSGPFAAVQSDVLELIATGASLERVLGRLASGVEGLLDEGLVSIQIVDGPVLRHVAGPSLPAAYTASIDGLPITPNLGSCLAAAASKQPVIVEDIATHANWAGNQHLALDHGLQACWSTPVMAPTGQVIGTFAVYYRRPMAPPAGALGIVDAATAMASIVMRHEMAQRALRVSEERFRQMAETIDDVFWLQDAETLQVLYVSPAFTTLWGLPCEALYADAGAALRLTLPEDRPALDATLRRTEVRGEAEFRIRRPDGDVRWLHGQRLPVFDAQGRLIRLVGVVHDITERKQLERQLLQGQRVETLGTLASGIAHDLNNVLTPILMAASSLRGDVPDATREALADAIEEGATRGAALVRQVLSFARGADGQKMPVAIGALVDDVGRLLRDTLPRNVEMTTEVAAALPPVIGDSSQLHQVLLNLVVNARDAMPEGGQITIEARRMRLPVGVAAGAPDTDGGYVCISVSDSGCGIPADRHDRIFDPFYTTKPLGQGSGLGLATVLAVVRRHGGQVSVESEVGRGTTFRVWLPATAMPSAPRIPVQAPGRPAAAGLRVLVVDDEEAILGVLKVSLERSGYEVLTARAGREALALLASRSGEVDFVLLDVMMPEMDGVTLAEAIAARYPRLTVAAATGLPTDAIRERLRAAGVVACLAKPYDANAVRQLIEANVGRPGGGLSEG